MLPEIQVATEAIESRIAITEGEVAQMKEGIAAKRELLRSLRKALITLNPKRTTLKRSTKYELEPPFLRLPGASPYAHYRLADRRFKCERPQLHIISTTGASVRPYEESE